jgi:molybdopterin-guanine dinucleotide biosynthesis protein B
MAHGGGVSGLRVIGIAGWSGAGKTTLVSRLLPALIERGLTVSTIKHAHHGFEIDQPGKDSYTHRTVGAQEILVSSSKRFALIHELRGAREPNLRELLLRLGPCDLVLVEGFKRESHPKIEVFRAANAREPLHPNDPYIRAIATDQRFETDLPQAHLDDARAIADLAVELAAPRDVLVRQAGGHA